MRKESLKKNSSANGVVDDGDRSVANDVDMNGGAVDADPLQGADQPVLDIPKKKGRKQKDTVTEVAIPLASNEDEGDYEVEDIVDHKNEKKGRMFLVRWKNCGPEDDTWEPESSLACPEIVKKYIENNPDADVQASSSSRKRTATKEKPAVPAKKSKAKNAASANDTGDSAAGEANGEEEYEVEDIVNHKTVRGKTQFLIRWKNYDESGDTWEPESSLSCPEIIEKYKEANMKDEDANAKPKREPKPKKDKTEKEYEVQLIVDEKMQDGVKHYLVRWRGYKMDDDTWEPEHSLNCPEIISKFHEFKKNKRTSGARGTPKKLTYTEVDETEGEDQKQIYVNGSSSKSKSKSKSKQTKGKKGAGKSKPQKAQKQKEEDYEVEEIVGEKMEKGKKYYFLKWKGWSSSNNTWELASSLSCPDILKKYQSKQKSEPKSPKTPKSAKSAKTKAAKKSKSPNKKSKSPSKPAKASKSKQKAVEAEEQDWEVEKIIDVRYNDDGSKDFLIRWKGCDSSQDTWEPQNNVNSPDLVNEFMNKTDDTEGVSAPKKKSRKA